MISETQQQTEKINWFLTLEMLLCAAMVWFTCSKNGTMASHCFTVSFIVLLLVFINYMIKKFEEIDEIDGLLLIIIAISVFSVFLSLFNAERAVTFEGLKSYFMFLSTVIFFRLAEKIKIGRKTADLIFGFNIIISLIYIYCRRAYPQDYVEGGSTMLTLNFSNPNFTALFVCISLLYMFLGIFYYKNIIMKGICLILSISNFSILLETGSRNPLVAFVLFLVIFILSYLKSNLRFTKWFSVIINASPTIFMVVYLNFISVIIEKGWLDFLVSRGKNLNSRVKIWEWFLEGLENKWLLGDYANLTGNAHNSHLVVLCSYGLIVLVLVIVFTHKISISLAEKTQNRFQFSCLMAFFAILFMGFGEGALYSGGLGIYILGGTFLTLANSDFERTDIIEENIKYDKI